jgi:hypothetical protein
MAPATIISLNQFRSARNSGGTHLSPRSHEGKYEWRKNGHRCRLYSLAGWRVGCPWVPKTRGSTECQESGRSYC